ncbi:MAG: hypothetical protein ACFFAN_03400 [Promethearchaeota archaeon]
MIIFIKIKEIDGIPCLILPEGVITYKDELKNTLKDQSKNFVIRNDFTDFQKLKEKNHMNDLLRELRRKFKDK